MSQLFSLVGGDGESPSEKRKKREAGNAASGQMVDLTSLLSNDAQGRTQIGGKSMTDDQGRFDLSKLAGLFGGS